MPQVVVNPGSAGQLQLVLKMTCLQHFPNQRRHSGNSLDVGLFLDITCGKGCANAPIFIYLVTSDEKQYL
jgi:hypothetical protein